jgi:hypothetical protein
MEEIVCKHDASSEVRLRLSVLDDSAKLGGGVISKKKT